MTDPLCIAPAHGLGQPHCICAELRTARLQGPVSVAAGHVRLLCFCRTCYPKGYES